MSLVNNKHQGRVSRRRGTHLEAMNGHQMGSAGMVDEEDGQCGGTEVCEHARGQRAVRRRHARRTGLAVRGK